MHGHRCTRCGATWLHGCCARGDVLKHTCTRCGFVQWWASDAGDVPAPVSPGVPGTTLPPPFTPPPGWVLVAWGQFFDGTDWRGACKIQNTTTGKILCVALPAYVWTSDRGWIQGEGPPIVIPCASFSAAPSPTSMTATSTIAKTPPVLRVWPLGDSNTVGFNGKRITDGYRAPLASMLADQGIAVHFVGTVGAAPLLHEGHGGLRIGQLDAGAFSVGGWFDRSFPMVEVQQGTEKFAPGINDVAGALCITMAGANDLPTRSAAQMIADVQKYVFDIGAAFTQSAEGFTSTGGAIVCTIPAVGMYRAKAQTYNAGVRAAVAAERSRGARMRVADIGGQLVAGDLAADQTHFSDQGYEKFARIVFETMMGAMSTPATSTKGGGAALVALGVAAVVLSS